VEAGRGRRFQKGKGSTGPTLGRGAIAKGLGPGAGSAIRAMSSTHKPPATALAHQAQATTRPQPASIPAPLRLKARPAGQLRSGAAIRSVDGGSGAIAGFLATITASLADWESTHGEAIRGAALARAVAGLWQRHSRLAALLGVGLPTKHGTVYGGRARIRG